MTLAVDRDPAVLSFAAALQGEPCNVHGLEDLPTPLPMTRWSGPADASDAALLAHCLGPVVDIGCGPGRMSEHLMARGMQVLGVDVVAEAVAAARRRGVAALHRDAFRGLPAEGDWGSVLLADGNIGIGGDPVRLLRRASALLAPGGRVIADLAPPGTGHARRTVELECAGTRSHPFPWSVLGPDSVTEIALAAGFDVVAVHVQGRGHEQRWFTVLSRSYGCRSNGSTGSAR